MSDSYNEIRKVVEVKQKKRNGRKRSGNCHGHCQTNTFLNPDKPLLSNHKYYFIIIQIQIQK